MASGFENPLEVIDAFVDGERVDATRFKAALADAEGRDYLVDAWMLREAARSHDRGCSWPRWPARSSPGLRWDVGRTGCEIRVRESGRSNSCRRGHASGGIPDAGRDTRHPAGIPFRR